MSTGLAQVILSARDVWTTAKDVEMTEKARTATMMAQKSRVEMVICCEGAAEVLGPATSTGAVVLGPRALEVQRKQGLWVIE